MVGTLSIGLKKQVCGLPHCPQGTDLSASTTQVETRKSSSLLESQSSKLSEKLGLWVFLPGCGPNPFHFLHVCSLAPRVPARAAQHGLSIPLQGAQVLLPRLR